MYSKLSSRPLKRAALIFLVLGALSTTSWIYFGSAISESPLLAFYFVPVLLMFSICGKHCEPVTSGLALVAATVVFAAQWAALAGLAHLLAGFFRKVNNSHSVD